MALGAGTLLHGQDAGGSVGWPQWRGPTADGVVKQGNPPIEWSETHNIRWKREIPGEGHSTPVVWGGRIYLLAAVPDPRGTEAKPEANPVPRAEPSPDRSRRRGGGQAPDRDFHFTVLCLDRSGGEILWSREASRQRPHEGRHPTNSFASGSPVTDGKHLIASFGSRGLYCYDMDGGLVWEKDLGQMHTRNGFGEGTSPALDGNTLVVLWDTEEDSWIYAFDKRDGSALWKQARDEPTTWSTPHILNYEGRKQVVVNATQAVRSYDLETGELLWECGGQTANAIPSVVSDANTVYAVSGYRGNTAMAISLGHRGDLTGGAAVRWSYHRGTPYVPSPLLYGGLLYFTQSNDAMLSCLNVTTGEPFYSQQRLEGPSGFYASPVGVADRVYLVGRNGTSVVVERSKELKIIATNVLEDPMDASPVVVGDELYLRGHHFLYCIAQKP